MAYYTTLINAWNSATQPPSGVIGTALTGLTTAQKIAAVNAWTIATPQRALVTSTQLLNSVLAADFAGLGVNGLSQLQIILTTPLVDISINSQIRSMLSTLFAGKTTTLANITALAAPFDNATTNWCLANGYPYNSVTGLGNLSLPDASNAGLI